MVCSLVVALMFYTLCLQGNDLTFEQMEAVRRDGGMSHETLKRILQKQKEKDKSRSFKRENKNRPMETSSKRPVPRLREVVQVTKRCSPLALLEVQHIRSLVFPH